ncbi:MAG: hypothetical protein WCX30_03215 [Candidatus Paceibacterota bacterium]
MIFKEEYYPEEEMENNPTEVFNTSKPSFNQDACESVNSEKEEPTPEELLEKFRNPKYLPTREEILHAFNYDSWNNRCNDRDNQIYEFLNKEFINSLSDYLSERIEKLGASESSPVIILEVGAGDGRLSHFLKERLETGFPNKVKVVATDSNEWKIKTVLPVEEINSKEALEKYNPQIVICSWMPYGEDFTADFRATKSVQEYILIGERAGCCGDEWLTWGIPSFNPEDSMNIEDEDDLTDNDFDFDSEDGSDEDKVPPYIADGFDYEGIDKVSKNQIAETDQFNDFHHSKTSSFRRKN